MTETTVNPSDVVTVRIPTSPAATVRTTHLVLSLERAAPPPAVTFLASISLARQKMRWSMRDDYELLDKGGERHYRHCQ
jgi:hypothetical protein